MHTTQLNLSDTLPLTCSRKGTCCHGNKVMLNPFEVNQLARAKNMSPKEFKEQYTISGGSQLKFDGKIGWSNQHACSQYIENFGCSVHEGRPLACRLFPLGRQVQNGKANYIYQGEQFPCVEGGCPEVLELPHITVSQYIQVQETVAFEQAQDAYLEMMQNIADIAFELLLETGLAESGDKKTIATWRKMGTESPSVLANRIGEKWLAELVVPAIKNHQNNASIFAQKHHNQFLLKVNEEMGDLTTFDECRSASIMLMAMALHLANSIGADYKSLANHWCESAIGFGAKG